MLRSCSIAILLATTLLQACSESTSDIKWPPQEGRYSKIQDGQLLLATVDASGYASVISGKITGGSTGGVNVSFEGCPDSVYMPNGYKAGVGGFVGETRGKRTEKCALPPGVSNLKWTHLGE